MDNKALAQLLLPFVRHALTAGGTLLGYVGFKDDTTSVEVAGLVAALIGFWLSKRNNDHKEAIKEDLAVAKEYISASKGETEQIRKG